MNMPATNMTATKMTATNRTAMDMDMNMNMTAMDMDMNMNMNRQKSSHEHEQNADLNQQKSCKKPGEFLVTKKTNSLHGGTFKQHVGTCMNPLVQAEGQPTPLNSCMYSACTDADNGLVPGKSTKDFTCSR